METKSSTGPRFYGHVRAINPQTMKRLRAKLGLKQETLAEVAKVTLRTVQRIEQGENVAYWNAEMVARALGEKMHRLFIYAAEALEVTVDRTAQTVTFAGSTDAERTDAALTPTSGFVLSLDGIILNSVGELVFGRTDEQTIRKCRGSYQRSLEDFAFALVYGSQISSKWHPTPVPTGKQAEQQKFREARALPLTTKWCTRNSFLIASLRKKRYTECFRRAVSIQNASFFAFHSRRR